MEIGENVRGADTFVIQSTCNDANHNMMELLIMIDALTRASAGSIVAVLPYYGYARQDRKVASRTPITAKLVADLIVAAGATRVVSMDMHAGQIQGFFNIPFDHLYAAPALLDHIAVPSTADRRMVVVSPDAGGVERARAYSKRLGATLVMVDKRRLQPNVAEVHERHRRRAGEGGDLLDDMIDTAGTLIQPPMRSSQGRGPHLRLRHPRRAVRPGRGAHPEERAQRVVVTDTIQLTAAARGCGKSTSSPRRGSSPRRSSGSSTPTRSPACSSEVRLPLRLTGPPFSATSPRS